MNGLHGHIDNKKDYNVIEDVDDLPEWEMIGKMSNEHRINFYDFLFENTLSVVNDSICPLLENFTWKSTKGKCIVDCFLIFQQRIFAMQLILKYNQLTI